VDLLKESAGELPTNRGAFQQYGERLDSQTDGDWIVGPIARKCNSYPSDSLVIIDSIRIKGQSDAIRRHFGSIHTTHVHLNAPFEVLKSRYANRSRRDIKEFSTYEETQENLTERNVPGLEEFADIVIDTDRCLVDEVMIKVASHLNLFGKEYSRLVDVVVGGQYGSEGKGQVSAYLSSEYSYLVRVGGPNAGHKVYDSPESFTYHGLPSGCKNSKAKVVIGPGATIYVPGLMEEIKKCGLSPSRLYIDEQATIITEDDRNAESEVKRLIGSTGQGVGEATARRIRFRGTDKVLLARDSNELRPFVTSTHDILEKAFSDDMKILLEGTQGTGLSLYHGNYPHVTSRDTTVAGCLAEAGISPSRVRKVVMVCRTYPIRVQNPDANEEGRTSGPMKREITLQEVSTRSGITLDELERTETTSTTHRKRRIAEFDWKLLRRAATLNAPTDIALTFADYLNIENRKARRFEMLERNTIKFIEDVERVAKAPVSLISTRFHFRSIIDRRSW
jgi:adenylosuccinate synthase